MCATYEIACMERMGTHGANGNVWLQISFGSRSSWAGGRLTALLGGINMPAQHIFNPEVKMLLMFIKKGF